MQHSDCSAGLAWGGLDGPHSIYAWPFTVVQMGHVIQSYQDYGGAPYFHHGIDMLAEYGTGVYTRSGGQVVNIGTTDTASSTGKWQSWTRKVTSGSTTTSRSPASPRQFIRLTKTGKPTMKTGGLSCLIKNLVKSLLASYVF